MKYRNKYVEKKIDMHKIINVVIEPQSKLYAEKHLDQII